LSSVGATFWGLSPFVAVPAGGGGLACGGAAARTCLATGRGGRIPAPDPATPRATTKTTALLIFLRNLLGTPPSASPAAWVVKVPAVTVAAAPSPRLIVASASARGTAAGAACSDRTVASVDIDRVRPRRLSRLRRSSRARDSREQMVPF